MKNQASLINNKLFKKGDRILVALSGGADSVCLVHALASVRDKLGIEVKAAHFIHGIRPEAAQYEYELVKKLCKSIDVELFAGEGHTPSYAQEHKMGLEEAARELRYSFLYKTMEESGCNHIATAHNLSDNTETVIFNMTRGSGLSGLSGIPPVFGSVIRPILGVSRSAIEAYDRENGLEYVTDKTNFDEKYSRNKIRHSVTPLLREINPSADKNIMKSGEIIRQTEDFLEISAENIMSCPRKKGAIPLSALKDAHKALHYYIYAKLFEEAGGDRNDLTSVLTDSIDELAEKGRVSSGLDIGKGYRAEVTYDALMFSLSGEESSSDGEILLEEGKRIIWNGWEVEIGSDKGVAFEKESLCPPFYVRSRRQGDSIPMASGHKSIKKYLIDKKIPVKSRDRIPIICDNKGVLLLGSFLKDGTRCFKDKGSPIMIECRRISSDDE